MNLELEAVTNKQLSIYYLQASDNILCGALKKVSVITTKIKGCVPVNMILSILFEILSEIIHNSVKKKRFQNCVMWNSCCTGFLNR